MYYCLQVAEVQHKLIDLHESAHMSSSVKLQIVRALDQTLRLRQGLDWFLGRNAAQTGAAAVNRPTGYQRATEILMSKQASDRTAGLKCSLCRIRVPAGDGQLYSKRAVNQGTS